MEVWIVESYGWWLEDEDAYTIEKVFDSKEKALKYIDDEIKKGAVTEVGHKKNFNYYIFDVE